MVVEVLSSSCRRIVGRCWRHGGGGPGGGVCWGEDRCGLGGAVVSGVGGVVGVARVGLLDGVYVGSCAGGAGACVSVV